MSAASKQPKYALANEKGEKPYVVEWQDWRTRQDWRTTRHTLVFARTAASANLKAMGRSRPGVWHKNTRRALFPEVPAVPTQGES
jgi:hypothetical protein